MKSISQFIKEHSGSHANDVTKTEFLEALAELDNVADELEEDVELNILADEREDVSEAKKSWKDAERSGYDAWMSNIKRNKNPNKKKGQERDSWFDGWDNAQLDSDNGDFDESFSEEKSSTGYELHHKTLGSAIDTAISHAKKQYGIEITDDERMDQVGMGPRKPANGKTNSYRLMGSDKSGKEKGVQVQVYNMGNKYELNMYKESVELEESVELDERTINGWKISTLPKSGEYNYTADKSGYASNKFHNLSAAEKFAEKNPSKNWHKESLDEKAPKIDSDKYAAHMNRNKKVVKKTSATQDYIKDVQKRSNKMGEAISMKNSINQYYYQDPKGVVQAVGSKDAMRKMNIKQAKDGNKGGSFSMNFKKHKVGDIIKEGKTKPVSQMTPKEKADNDARRKEYKAFQKSMKKESVEIDETVGALGMESAAKAIEKYAKSHGGIDEKDFMIAAKLLRKGLDMKLKKFVDDMDTEPREYVITAMAKSMGKKNVEKMFGVKLREKVIIENVSPKQIDMLRKQYSDMPDRLPLEQLMKMSKMVAKFDKESLMKVAKADIKWISSAAKTNLISKHGAVAKDFKESVEVDERAQRQSMLNRMFAGKTDTSWMDKYDGSKKKDVKKLTGKARKEDMEVHGTPSHSADKKPQSYRKPNGKMGVKMVPMDSQTTRKESVEKIKTFGQFKVAILHEDKADKKVIDD